MGLGKIWPSDGIGIFFVMVKSLTMNGDKAPCSLHKRQFELRPPPFSFWTVQGGSHGDFAFQKNPQNEWGIILNHNLKLITSLTINYGVLIYCHYH
jgi:hypothetical protein